MLTRLSKLNYNNLEIYLSKREIMQILTSIQESTNYISFVYDCIPNLKAKTTNSSTLKHGICAKLAKLSVRILSICVSQ